MNAELCLRGFVRPPIQARVTFEPFSILHSEFCISGARALFEEDT